jgi:hypothetical protein
VCVCVCNGGVVVVVVEDVVVVVGGWVVALADKGGAGVGCSRKGEKGYGAALQ